MVCALARPAKPDLARCLLITGTYLTRQLRAHGIELRADGRVDEAVAELDLGAAQQRGVDREGRADALAAHALEPGRELLALRRAELDRSGDLRGDDALAAVDEVAVRARDVREQRETVALEEHAEDGADGARLAPDRGLEDLAAA